MGIRCLITVTDGPLITKKYLGKHKVITAEQQFLGLINLNFSHSHDFKLKMAFAASPQKNAIATAILNA